jgi:hypothetical protein
MVPLSTNCDTAGRIPRIFVCRLNFLVQRRETLNLRLRHVHIEAFFVHRGRLQFVRRHQEPTAAQPATRVDYDIANVAIVRIENYVINLAQLLIPRAVHGAANVVMSRLKP